MRKRATPLKGGLASPKRSTEKEKIRPRLARCALTSVLNVSDISSIAGGDSVVNRPKVAPMTKCAREAINSRILQQEKTIIKSIKSQGMKKGRR